MFNAFDTVTLSYSDASYRLAPARGGVVGVLFQLGKELVKRRMPSHRIWALLQAEAKCTSISKGCPPAKGEEVKPYDSYIVRKVVFTPSLSAGPGAVASGVERAMTFFGNEGLGEKPPVVVLASKTGEVELPNEPKQRIAAIKSFFQPAR